MITEEKTRPAQCYTSSRIPNSKKTVKTLITKPFLKWVGGKRSILPELLRRIPGKYNAYKEPFLGGGALYFALQPKKSFLSDINFHLILTFNAVKDDVDAVIALLEIHSKNHCKEYFLEARENLANEINYIEIAALFIYINKTCFNGLYRVNKSGKFNVPMGAYENPMILDRENLNNVSKILQSTTIEQHDFNCTKIKKGDFYYIDPPYHETYDGYSGKGFGDDKHIELAEFCRKIDIAGAYFMVSNSDTSLVRKIYNGYNIDIVSASRFVSCKAHQRGRTNELLIRNYW